MCSQPTTKLTERSQLTSGNITYFPLLLSNSLNAVKTWQKSFIYVNYMIPCRYWDKSTFYIYYILPLSFRPQILGNFKTKQSSERIYCWIQFCSCWCMLLFIDVIDFVQKGVLKSFFALVISLPQHILPLYWQKYHNFKVPF